MFNILNEILYYLNSVPYRCSRPITCLVLINFFRYLFSQAALNLPQRPPLHCSTLIPIMALALKFLMQLLRLKDSWCFLPWMLFISWTSHHVRDGIRHGLWFCPFGKTAPLPYWLYVAITASLPNLCSLALYLTGTREMMTKKHGIHIDV